MTTAAFVIVSAANAAGIVDSFTLSVPAEYWAGFELTTAW